jgi:hypothetical protein
VGVTKDRLSIGLTTAGHDTLTALQDFYRDRVGAQVTPSYIMQAALEALVAEVRYSEPGEAPRTPSTSEGPILPVVPISPEERESQRKRAGEESRREVAERLSLWKERLQRGAEVDDYESVTSP